MPLLVTEAIVLHVANYLESSRLLRLLTRESGVQSVVARGARGSKRRFGSAVDLFARGQAQIDVRPGRDLHTLVSFDVQHSHPGLAHSLSRFSAASAIAECALRVVHEESAPLVYEGLMSTLGTLAVESGDVDAEITDGSVAVGTIAVGALWRLTRDIGFAPTVDHCAECHDEVGTDVDVTFSHIVGGVLCRRCSLRAPGGRRLPPDARQALSDWLVDRPVQLTVSSLRAHQRLVREFMAQHMTDGRPLRAFLSWENGGLDHKD